MTYYNTNVIHRVHELFNSLVLQEVHTICGLFVFLMAHQKEWNGIEKEAKLNPEGAHTFYSPHKGKELRLEVYLKLF